MMLIHGARTGALSLFIEEFIMLVKRVPLKMQLPPDYDVGFVHKSSCMSYTLRYSTRCLLIITRKLLLSKTQHRLLCAFLFGFCKKNGKSFDASTLVRTRSENSRKNDKNEEGKSNNHLLLIIRTITGIMHRQHSIHQLLYQMLLLFLLLVIF